MRILACAFALLASGCIVPRSMITGQMAAPVGRGATDVGVFTGVLYGSQTNPGFVGQDAIGDPITTAQRSSGFSLPAFEANLQYGFNDHVGLNVHASSAGLQPGVKFTVNKSKVAHFALMPQVAFGYGSTGSVNLVSGADGVQREGGPTSNTSFTFLGGLKLLVSAKFNKTAAFFAGAGYDFIFNRNFNAAQLGAVGSTSESSSTINSTTGHQIAVSVGFDIALGWVHLRPEVAFGVYPGIAQSRTINNPPDSTTVAATGGFGWAIFPGFTLSVQSPQRELTAEEEEEEAERAKEEARKKKRRGGEDDDDTDDDEDGNRDDEDERPKAKLKKKRQLDDDEEEENPRKKRRPIDQDDED
ncbi:MAG: hypothetical protein JNM17_25155, partial [Archangium sp.]|nr:hypothetical protein [Archangium sp.]